MEQNETDKIVKEVVDAVFKPKSLVEKLYQIYSHSCYTHIDYSFTKNDKNYYREIRQALIEHEKLKKVLDILKSKIKFEVNDKSLFGFNQNNLVINKDIFGSVSLTQEEFDLLKGWLGNGTK